MSLQASTQPILIVEDSDDDYESTVRALQKDGNLVNPIFRCTSADVALDYLLRKAQYASPVDAPRPGIVLLDLNMPGRDGRAVIDAMKQAPALREIPVVVLTTSNDEKDIHECYAMGASTYITKPVDLERFISAIQRLKEYWFEVAILPKEFSDEGTEEHSDY
jgi:CheY-like chemotaxis protein